MDGDVINKVTADLQEKYPNIGIQKIDVNEGTGVSTFYLNPTKKSLAFIENNGLLVPKIFRQRERAAVITRDTIDRTVLDLSPGDPYDEDPINRFKRAIRYYYTEPIVGTTINLLATLAAKGFENDIDDDNIKSFYDVWGFDVNLEELLEWIFLDFFKTGHVTTYKVLAKYEPRVSHISPTPGKSLKKDSKKVSGNNYEKTQERHESERLVAINAVIEEAISSGIKSKKKLNEIENAAKKNIWSKGHLPVAYTVLNPTLVTIKGNLLFDKVSIDLTPPPELKEMLGKDSSDLTEDEKDLIKALPSDLKLAAEKGGSYKLDSRLVGSITYRKEPYEKYAFPRTTRVFDVIEYKKSLREADLSTLDGISNYILKITIGSDEYPVTSQAELEAVSQLFNTPSKSFDVVWNHTLQVEKIVSPEIESILGKDKYEQVNEDLTGGLGVSRAIIDGTGNITAAEVSMLVKGLMEEINYARRQVTRWLYREYGQIAEAVGFDRFPKIRWDEGILKDTIMYMNTLATLVDRRMVSYKTALEELGYDFPSELNNMEEELPMVQKGTFGIIGSPFQQSKIQPTQNAPTGTPSSGRPSGQPAKKKDPSTTEAKLTVMDVVKDMSDDEFKLFKQELEVGRKSNEEDLCCD